MDRNHQVLMLRLAIVSFLLLMCSCDNFTKVSFWRKFKKGHLQENVGNQGFYGGHTSLYWKSQKAYSFKPKEIIEYAKLNGWELVDSLEFKAANLKSWVINDKWIFPLSYEGFVPHSEAKTTYKFFPRWINEDIKVYTFKTGIVMIEPGTDNSIDVNGFVVIGNDGSKMSVYHLWGE